MKAPRGHFDQSEFLRELTVEKRWAVLVRVLYRLAWMRAIHPDNPYMAKFRQAARGRSEAQLRIK